MAVCGNRAVLGELYMWLMLHDLFYDFRYAQLLTLLTMYTDEF